MSRKIIKRVLVAMALLALIASSAVATAAPTTTVPITFDFKDGDLKYLDVSGEPHLFVVKGELIGKTDGDQQTALSKLMGEVLLLDDKTGVETLHSLQITAPAGIDVVDNEDEEYKACFKDGEVPGKLPQRTVERFTLVDVKLDGALAGTGQWFWGVQYLCEGEDKEFVEDEWSELRAVLITPQQAGRLNLFGPAPDVGEPD